MKPDVAIVGGGAIGVCCASSWRGGRVVILRARPRAGLRLLLGKRRARLPEPLAPISNPASLRNGLR